jgi:prepilin-type N-terminal cleavage/methylation domain-containing protein
MTHRAALCRRLGFTMIEVLLVVGVAAIMFAMVVPRMAAISTSSSMRAARQELIAVFAAARAAALQKGKVSTLTLDGSSARVSVQSGLNGTVVSVFGPIKLDTEFGVTLTALSDSPVTLNFDARGMLTPTPASNLQYRLSSAASSDTLCISPAGIIMPKGCQL